MQQWLSYLIKIIYEIKQLWSCKNLSNKVVYISIWNYSGHKIGDWRTKDRSMTGFFSSEQCFWMCLPEFSGKGEITWHGIHDGSLIMTRLCKRRLTSLPSDLVLPRITVVGFQQRFDMMPGQFWNYLTSSLKDVSVVPV